MGNEDWKKRLSDPGYRNWLKVSLALMESKEALHEFTENVIKDVHNGIKAKVGPGVCTGTPICNTNKGQVGKEPACQSCTDWVREIKSQKSAGIRLNWKNANPKIWHNTPWEIAKCFMNAQGSKTTSRNNTGPAKTDTVGMLNVLVNCKEFRHHLSDKKLPENARAIRNELMHNATMTFSDAEMQNRVDKIIALLEDGKELKNLPISREKIKVIKSLRDSKFELQPDQEEACINTVLKSHDLSVESGEGVDENMSKFLLDKVLKLIKGYQDLEEKFHDKIINVYEYVDNIKHEHEAKFSSIEVQFGNLKGIVESLQAERLQNETSVPTQSKSSLLAVHEKSLFKNALQSYTQKKGLDLPNYDTLRNECTKLFVSTVSVNGQKFESEPKPLKKEAEQKAAEKALAFLARGNVMDDHNDSNESESPALEPAPVVDATSPQQKGKVSYKNRLQERAQSQQIPNPIYDSEKTNDGFLSKVLFGECWYTPDVSPQKRKVDAEQKAAQFVLAILDRADDSNFGKEETLQAQPDSSEVDAGAALQPSLTEETIATNETAKEAMEYFHGLPSDNSASSMDASPAASSPGSDKADSGNVSVGTEITVSPSPNKLCRRADDSNFGKEETDAGAALQPSLTEETIATNETVTLKSSQSALDKGDGKTYKSMLHEYAQKNGITDLHFEEIPNSDGNDNEFRSMVKISDLTFECPGSFPKKKHAKEMAAKEAMEYFHGLSSYNSASSKDGSPAASSPGSDKPDSGNVSVAGTEITACPSPSKLSCSVERQQASPSPAKTLTNFKGRLGQYLKKENVDPRYDNHQDQTTKKYLSKVFVGKRCFKGKDLETRKKDAESHVAKIALDALEGHTSVSDPQFKEALNTYHRKLDVTAFPKYEKASCDRGGKYSVVVKVVKKHEIPCESKQQRKRAVEVMLAEKAIRQLEGEKKAVPAGANAKSRFNLFTQLQVGAPKPDFKTSGDQSSGFTGSLIFYEVVEYESLAPQASEDEAVASAAMSACNGMDLF